MVLTWLDSAYRDVVSVHPRDDQDAPMSTWQSATHSALVKAIAEHIKPLSKPDPNGPQAKEIVAPGVQAGEVGIRPWRPRT